MSNLLNGIRRADAAAVIRALGEGTSLRERSEGLAECIDSGDVAILALMLDRGVDPNAIIEGSGWSLLHYAIEQQSAEAVELLLKHGAHVDVIDRGGGAPLHYAVDVEADTASQRGEPPKPDLTEILLRAGADPMQEDSRGRTPLGEAEAYEFDAAVQAMRDALARIRT